MVNLKSKKGFTLIELLVVIGILAVLMAIGIPSVAGLIDRANVSADDTNGNEMTNAVERFVSEYELYRQDISSNRINFDDLDSAQSRVFNSIKASNLEEIKDLESLVTHQGYRLDKDTKYPRNWETTRSIIQNYIKTSSATFLPKQSDKHFYYSPDCGLVVWGDESNQKIADSILAEKLNKNVISGKNAKGQPLDENTTWINISIDGDPESGERTNYTLEDIENNPLLYGIGRTKREYVVAEFNSDYTTVTITKNGEDSDGYMVDWSNFTTPIQNPMYANRSTLKSVIVSDGVKNIGARALAMLETTDTIKLANSIEEIGKYGCRQSGFTSLKLPENLKLIDDYAFTDCKNIQGDLIIPDSVVEINHYAFSGCLKISGLEIGDGTKFIGTFAFGDSTETGLRSLKIGKSVEFIGAGAFQMCSYVTNEIVLPDTLRYIGDFAFNHLAAVSNTSLRIPASVVQIGGFTPADSKKVYLNNYESVVTYPVGSHTFYRFGVNSGSGANNFAAFIVDEGNQHYKSVDGVLYSKDGKRLLAYPSSKCGKTYEILEGVQYIDEMTFSHAYYNKNSDRLEKVILPDSYTILLPENNYPTQINPQNSLTNAFYSNCGVREVGVKATNTKYMTNDGILYSKNGSTCYYIPAFKTNVNIIEGCTKLERCYFRPTTALRSTAEKTFVFNIPASVTQISDYGSSSYPDENTLRYMNDLIGMSQYFNATFNIDVNNSFYTTDSNGRIVKK